MGRTINISDTGFKRTCAYRDYGDSAVGVFDWGKSYTDNVLLPLDYFDKTLVKNVKLKKGEVIFRYENKRSKIGGFKPLIKINVEKGLVYHLTDDAWEFDEVAFEKKGIPVRYLTLRPLV